MTIPSTNELMVVSKAGSTIRLWKIPSTEVIATVFMNTIAKYDCLNNSGNSATIVEIATCNIGQPIIISVSSRRPRLSCNKIK